MEAKEKAEKRRVEEERFMRQQEETRREEEQRRTAQAEYSRQRAAEREEAWEEKRREEAKQRAEKAEEARQKAVAREEARQRAEAEARARIERAKARFVGHYRADLRLHGPFLPIAYGVKGEEVAYLLEAKADGTVTLELWVEGRKVGRGRGTWRFDGFTSGEDLYRVKLDLTGKPDEQGVLIRFTANGLKVQTIGEPIPTGTLLGSPTWADLNGDGKREYLVTEHSGDSTWLRVIAAEDDS